MFDNLKEWILPEQITEQMLACEQALNMKKKAYTYNGSRYKINAVQKNCIMLRRFMLLFVLGSYWIFFFLGMKDSAFWTVFYLPLMIFLFSFINGRLFVYAANKTING